MAALTSSTTNIFRLRILSAALVCGEMVLPAMPAADRQVSTSVKPEDAASARKKVEKEKQDALSAAHALRDRFLKFHDRAKSAVSLSLLGAAVCKYDRPFATQLFEDAMAGMPSAGTVDINSASDRDYVSKRSGIVARAAQCDTALAARQTDVPGDAGARASASMRAAFSALDADPDGALGLAQAVLPAGSSAGNMQQLAMFLVMLRKKAPARADAAFLNAVQTLLASPQTDAGGIGSLGYYAFTAPDLLASGTEGAVTIMVGGAAVPNLAGTRPNLPSELVVSYLQAAADVLSRPFLDAPTQEQISMTAALASELLPHAAVFNPALVPVFETIIQQYAAGSDPSMPETLNSLTAAATSDDTILQEISSAPEAGARDSQRVQWLGQIWGSDRTGLARDIASHLENAELRTRFGTLLTFAEARKAAQSGNGQLATQLAGEIPEGVKQALVYLRLPPKRGDARTYSAADIAEHDAILCEPQARPYLLLSAAHLLLSSDVDLALSATAQAVESFNQIDRSVSQRSNTPTLNQDLDEEKLARGVKEHVFAGPSGTYEVVEAGGQTHRFLLDSGAQFSLSETVAGFVPLGRYADVFALSDSLEDEGRRGEALTAIAHSRLARAFEGKAAASLLAP